MRADSLLEASPSTPSWDEDNVPPLQRSLRDWRSIVLGAYVRQPTLSLTTRQGQRLFGMEAPTCNAVLDGLVETGMLARTADGQYCRRDNVGAVDPTGML